MTRILLIRHSNTDLLNVKLCGRLPGISLNAEGRTQAEAVGRFLRDRVTLQAVYASPLERAAETALAIARFQDVAVETDPRLNEMEFGVWTGLTFKELHTLEAWHLYNANRSLQHAPGGESLMQVQARAWDHLSDIVKHRSEQTVAVVTHSDVVRALLVLFLGMPLDHLSRLTVSPASVTDVSLGGAYPVVNSMNVLSSC